MKRGFIKGILNTSAAIDLFPLRHTLKNYDKSKVAGDVRAGLSVAMLSFSMSIAYAMIAGLPVHYGLFGCIIAAFVSFVFSSSHYIMFGPSNASAIMLMSAFASLGFVTESERVAAASSLVMLVGVLLVVASALKITNFIRYISRTVVTAYICVGAILIIAKQFFIVCGIKAETKPMLYDIVKAFVDNISGARFDAVIIAAATFAIYYACKIFFKRLPAQAVALIGAAIVYAVLQMAFGFDVACVSAVSVTDWAFTFPSLTMGSFRDLTFASVAVALFCVIEATSIGKSLAAKNADRLNTNQETFSLGLANIAAGMFSGTVESGSLTRSAAGAEAGAKTQFVNLFSGVFMLIGVLLLGGFIAYIPLPALSAVIIAIAFPLFSRKALRLALKSTTADRVVFLLTFFTGMIWSLDDSVYVGVGASIVLFLQKASSPEVVEVAIGDDGEERKVTEEAPRAIPEISIVHVGGNLFFGASDVFQDQIRRITSEPNLKIILLKLRNAINFDATSAGDIEEIARQMESRGGVLLLSEVAPDIMRILKRSGVARNIGEENIFPATDDNPTLSAALALRHAKKILGNSESDVKIYV